MPESGIRSREKAPFETPPALTGSTKNSSNLSFSTSLVVKRANHSKNDFLGGCRTST
jgi:hypothetical protein